MASDAQYLSLDDFEDFYKKHRDEIRRYLNSLARDPEEADDVAQNTFIKFMDLVGEGKVEKASARALLFRMAHNKFIDAYRRRRREQTTLEKQAQESTPVAKTSGEEMRLMIVDALRTAALPERARVIVEMRILGEYTIEEIGKHLGIGRSTIYNELERAMPLLRKILTEAGFHEGL